MKKIVKVSGHDVKNMVNKIVEHTKMNEILGLVDEPIGRKSEKGFPIRRSMRGDKPESTKYAYGTRWPRNLEVLETYGPITIYISADRTRKVAEHMGRFFDESDREISREEAEQLLGTSLDQINENKGRTNKKRTIRLTESEMVDFLDNLAKKVENGRRRRGIR